MPMKKNPKESTRHIDAVKKALDILDCFQQASELTISDLMQQVQIHRSRAMRLTGTLEANGYLVRNQENGKYRLGAKILRLAAEFEQNNEMRHLVRPVLKRLASDTGESVALYFVEGIERVVLIREEGTQAIRYSIPEGKRSILYAGAGGKAILAFSSDELIEQVLSRKLNSITPATITDPKKILKELESVRRKGYAISVGETHLELTGIATPIFGAHGQVVGSVGLVSPSIRATGIALKKNAKKIVKATIEISRLLGAPERLLG